MNHSKIYFMKKLRKHKLFLLSSLLILLVVGWGFQQYFLRAKPKLPNHFEEECAASKEMDTTVSIQENSLVQTRRQMAPAPNPLHYPEPLEVLIPIFIRVQKKIIRVQKKIKYKILNPRCGLRPNEDKLTLKFKRVDAQQDTLITIPRTEIDANPNKLSENQNDDIFIFSFTRHLGNFRLVSIEALAVYQPISFQIGDNKPVSMSEKDYYIKEEDAK